MRGGFLEIEEDGAFDAITAINDPFSHMLTGQDKSEALRRSFRALRPGGVLLIDVPNFLWILRHYSPPAPMRASIDGGEVHLRREHTLDFHAAVFTTVGHYHLVRDGESHPSSKAHPDAMTTFPELAFHLESAGFHLVETYHSWDARGAEPLDGPRMIVSAVRPV